MALAMSMSMAAGWAAGAPAPKGATPDLQGVWTLGTYTPLERPKDLTSLALTPAEAEAYEAPRRALHGMPPSKADEPGQAETEQAERGDGLARVRGEIRSSWVVDPSDGQIPFTREARLRLGLDKPRVGRPMNNPEDAPATDRCVGNLAGGVPMIGGPDANLVELVQTSDAVAILTEKYHDVRIVSLKGRSPYAGVSPGPLGSSVGHWEGDALVVETSGFPDRDFVRQFNLVVSGQTTVTERFTRLGKSELLYEFKVSDPSLYTRPWSGEMTLHPAKGRIYEYACHEGNYWMRSMLQAARLSETAPNTNHRKD